jgi:hypothetical protein
MGGSETLTHSPQPAHHHKELAIGLVIIQRALRIHKPCGCRKHTHGLPAPDSAVTGMSGKSN